MKVIKLKYENKETAIADLLAKGAYVEIEDENQEKQLYYAEGVHAIVELGLIVLEDGTYDEDFNEVTAPVYADGYHYDVLTDNEIPFENEIEVNNPKHSFYGV
jgi:hypothetical protein